MQIELHPRFAQKGLRVYCKQHDIIVVAYASLGCGALLSHKTVQRIAQQCGQTPAQVGLCMYCLPLKATIRLRALHLTTMPGSCADLNEHEMLIRKPEQGHTSRTAASMSSSEPKAPRRPAC